MAGVRGQGRRFDVTAALDGAMQVFWRHGYEGTSITDLTKAMGITASSLYGAFEGKRHLFDLVVNRYLDTSGRFTSVVLEEEKDALSLVRRLLFEAANEYANPDGLGGCFVVSAATCVTAANQEVEDKLSELRKSNIESIEKTLRSSLESGTIPSETDPEAVAYFIGTVLQGMAQRGRDGATATELRNTASMSFDAIERILRHV